MSHEEPVIHDTPAPDTAVQAPETPAYEPIEAQDEWLEEPAELPRRPRRRLLGAGGNPIPLALTGVLLIACGFIGGVLVEKGQSTSSSSAGAAASLASRFRALRGGASSAGTSSTFSRPVAGQVAYIAGSTLYVTNSEGNTVKVTTSAGTSVTKTVKATLKGIHPGETVTVTGATGSGGALSAESISVGAGGGIGALFGGAGAGGSGRGSGGGGEPALFGRGG
jgi:hypothetical protein